MITAKVRFKKLNEKAIVPVYGSEGAAAADLFACIPEPVEIQPHTTAKIGTGIAMEMPDFIFAAIFARSGLATKQGLRPANCVGVCDSDYRGEYIVALHNDSDEIRTIYPQDRIAQVCFLPFYHANFVEVEDLSNTVRNDGGFGSTGV